MNPAVKASDTDNDPATAPQVMLDVRNVTLSFGGVHAIKDVSFNINKGEIRAIIGPNGAGKTSMLNVINGFYNPQDGEITFQGETRTQMRPYIAAAGHRTHLSERCAVSRACRRSTTSCPAEP